MLLNNKLNICKYQSSPSAKCTFKFLLSSSIKKDLLITSLERYKSTNTSMILGQKILINATKYVNSALRKVFLNRSGNTYQQQHTDTFSFFKTFKFSNNNNNSNKCFKTMHTHMSKIRFNFNEVLSEMKALIKKELKIFRKKSMLFFNSSKKNFYLAASIGIFNWQDNKITNDEIRKEVNEILCLFGLENSNEYEHQSTNSNNGGGGDGGDTKRFKRISFKKSRNIETNEWKLIYNEKDLVIWRRDLVLKLDDLDDQQRDHYDLYEYKILGRMHDVTPMDFFRTQIDLEYRKKWDHLVVSLDTIHKDEEETNTELIKWIMRFPYPLYPREYIYARRYCVEPEERLLVLVSRGVSESVYNENNNENNSSSSSSSSSQGHHYVRVNNYKSNMIIIPHSDFNENGFDYVIQYYDINKAKIPKLAYKWMATSGNFFFKADIQ
jgi:hypothetical protein